MDKLFIDTCIFVKKGLNFDKNNTVIEVLINNARANKFEYQNLSVIDKEIISHINEKIEPRYKILSNDFKWIKRYISDDIIKSHIEKDLQDYNEFKILMNSNNCDVSEINPEEVFEKYFQPEYPFEDNEDKRSEFPDAFISAYINNLCRETTDRIFMICNDNGLLKSLDPKVEKFKNLENFLIKMNIVNPKEFSQIKGIISSRITNIGKSVFERFDMKLAFLEYKDVDIEEVFLSDSFILNILDVRNNTYYVNCIFDELLLKGNFISVDYDSPDMVTFDDDGSPSLEYIGCNKIIIPKYEVPMKITVGKEITEITYDEKYPIIISYDHIKMFSEDEQKY